MTKATGKNGNGDKTQAFEDSTNKPLMTIPMSLKKETPGTRVYTSDDPDAFVNQVYIKKSGKTGDKITLIVS